MFVAGLVRLRLLLLAAAASCVYSYFCLVVAARRVADLGIGLDFGTTASSFFGCDVLVSLVFILAV